MSDRTGENPALSLPLYGAAFVATLCGILTVTETVDDAAFTQTALALACAGFAFSLGCRALRFSARFVEWLCIGVITLGIGGTLSGRFAWGALIPVTVNQADMRLAVLLCWAAVLLSWTLLHDSMTLFAPVLSVAMIGLVSSFDLNNYVAAYFVILLITAIFLLMHLHTLRLRAVLGIQGQSIPMGLHIPKQLGLAAACGLAVVILGVLLVAPVEALSHNLSLAGAIRQLANLASSPASSANAFRFSDDANFEIGTGSGWSASATILARVVSSDGEPHLWLGRTYDRYDGAGWQSTLSDQWSALYPEMAGADGTEICPLPTVAYPGREVVVATFDLLGGTDEFLTANVPRRLEFVTSQSVLPRYCADGRLDIDSEHAPMQMHYSETSLIAPDPMDPAVQSHLRQAGSAYPGFIRSHYLDNMTDALESEMDPGALAYFRRVVAACINGLPRSRRDPIDVALALRLWVSNHCVYSLNVEPLPPQEDHVYDFLAKTKRGYCDMYASSLAVLCRVAGLPARVATGFAPGVPDGDAYDLRALDRHAWTEVYFPGSGPDSGWLDFDATIGTPTDGSVPDPKSGTSWDWSSLMRRLGFWPVVLAALIVGVLGYVLVTEWRARRRGQSPARKARARADDEVGRQYALMSRALAGLGMARKRSETPDEFSGRARAFLRSHVPDGPDPALVALLTDELNRSRYDRSASLQNSEQSSERSAAMRAFVQSALRLRLRLLLHWRPGQPERSV